MNVKNFQNENTQIQNWSDYQSALIEFLASDERFIVLGNEGEIFEILMNLNVDSISQIDLLQFCDLGILGRGYLGIRELRWKISHFLVKSNLVSKTTCALTFVTAGATRKLQQRYNQMQTRNSAINNLVGELAGLGIAIPHYIEPCVSTVVISRKFAEALVELNSSGTLTFHRGIFAIARSSNYVCLRISGYQSS
jgi:hypothetical protein